MTELKAPDIAYITEFNLNLSPVHINAVLTANGFNARPINGKFTWCDFGCGNGITACTLAAAYPDGHFIGIDSDAKYIDFAKFLAEKSKLENVTFICKSFDELTKEEIPELDFAVMHKVISWIVDTERDALIDYTAEKLKKGGALLASYNTFPGWSTLMHVRNMLHSIADKVLGSPEEKAKAAVDWLDSIKKAKGQFFLDNPAVADLVDDLKADPKYVVHEYFSENMKPFHFTEVYHSMQKRGLNFSGSSSFFLNMADLAVMPELQHMLAEAETRTEFEAKRDFIRNEHFHSDVYCKGEEVSSIEEWQENHEDIVLGTLYDTSFMEKEVNFGGVQLNYDSPPLSSIIKDLAFNSKKVANIFGDRALSVDAARLLLAGEQIVPFTKAVDAEPVLASSSEKFGMSSAFNKAVIQHMAFMSKRIALASDLAGTGVEISNLDAVLLFSLCETGIEEAVDFAISLMEMTGQKIRNSRGEEMEKQEVHSLFEQRLNNLFEKIIPKLINLGIIEKL